MVRTSAQTYTFKENESRTICYKTLADSLYTTFSQSDVISVDIPEGMTVMPQFTVCINLKKVNSNVDGKCIMPNGITTVSLACFAGCTGLTSIEIPDSVTSIGEYAFSDCTNLTSITIEATTPPTLGTDALKNTNNCPIYVPSDSVAAYQAASDWSAYSVRIKSVNELQV